MREHYNNLQKIQAQDSKSNLQTETRYSDFSKYPYDQLLKVSCKSGNLRTIVCIYAPNI